MPTPIAAMPPHVITRGPTVLVSRPDNCDTIRKLTDIGNNRRPAVTADAPCTDWR